MSLNDTAGIAFTLNRTNWKIMAWYFDPTVTYECGLRDFGLLGQMTMQSTGSQSFTVYVYMRIAVADIEQLIYEPSSIAPPVIAPAEAVTAPVEMKVKLQIDEVPKKEADEKAQNGVLSEKDENVAKAAEGKLKRILLAKKLYRRRITTEEIPNRGRRREVRNPKRKAKQKRDIRASK